MCKNAFPTVLTLDFVLVESTVTILPPEDGENVARMTCVSDVSMSLYDT